MRALIIALFATATGAASAACPTEGRLQAAADSQGRGLYVVRMSEDEYLQHRIAQALDDELRHHAQFVAAAVDNGVVNLEGRTDEQEYKERAVAIASTVDGVRKINADMLEVE